jgi:hypothetical protein
LFRNARFAVLPSAHGRRVYAGIER